MVANKGRFWGLVVGLTLAGRAAPLEGQPDRPALRRAREIIELINTGTPAAIRAYADSAYHESMREPNELQSDLGLEGDVLGFFLKHRELASKLAYLGFDAARPTHQAIVDVRAQLTGLGSRLVVVVEKLAPYRIVGLGEQNRKVAAGAAPAGRIPSDRALAVESERLVSLIAKADQFSGMALLAKDGRVLFQRAYGLADRAAGIPNRVTTRFEVASVTKVFTAVAVARLAEAGQLSYQDTLSKFLPGFPTPAASRQIQLKHLLTHTAGLDDFVGRDTTERRSHLFRTVGQLMKFAEVDSLLFAPGTDWNYSNLGYITLGRIIELVSHQDYFEYLARQVFAPAGMSHTDFPELDRVPLGLARGYEPEYTAGGAKKYRERFGEGVRGGPHGGAYSTAEDLLRFVTALQGGRLVKAETLAILTSAKPDLKSPEWGYGFQVDPMAGTFGHTGGVPGGSSSVDIFGTSGYVLILLANGGIGQRDNLRFELGQLVMRRRA